MSQNKILLVLLSVVVAAVILVGIKLAAKPVRYTSENEIRQDLITIAVRAQGWYYRQAEFGGGGGSFAGITFDNISFDTKNNPGKFIISHRQKNKFRVTAKMANNNNWSSSLDIYPDRIEPVSEISMLNSKQLITTMN